MRGMIQLVGAMLILSASTAFAKTGDVSTEDSKAIDAILKEYEAGLNSGAASRIGALLLSDANRIDVGGTSFSTAKDIENNYAELLSGPMKGAKFTLEKKGLRLINPNAAILDSTFKIELAGNAGVISGFATKILVKSKGKWKIMAIRGMIPFVPPATK
jgi:uncharacterized protein (TIGR02246 family)